MKIEIVPNAPQTLLGKKVHNYFPKTGETQTMLFEQSVGFAVPTSRSKKDQLIVLVGLENKIVELDLSVPHIVRTVLHVPESVYVKGMRFNDGKCNPDGELFAGYMSTKWREGRRGYLYRMIQGVPAASSTDGSVASPKSVLKNILPRDGIHLPNGTAWLGNDTMFLIDSAENEITRLLFSALEGIESTTKRVTERKLIYKLPQQSIDLGYMLDGMTIDNKGKLWVALCGAGCVLRIDPATGQEVFRLHLDTKYPTSCTFGGTDLSDLYITTRNEGDSDSSASGNLICARIDGVKGIDGAVSVNLDLLSTIEEEPVEFNCMAVFCGFSL